MKSQDIVTRFGGKQRVIDATKNRGIDDMYCFEIDKWFTQKYWEAKMKENHSGVSLRDLVREAKL